jgi:hypothetical protein
MYSDVYLTEEEYKQKYLKYKQKYIELKAQMGGVQTTRDKLAELKESIKGESLFDRQNALEKAIIPEVNKMSKIIEEALQTKKEIIKVINENSDDLQALCFYNPSTNSLNNWFAFNPFDKKNRDSKTGELSINAKTFIDKRITDPTFNKLINNMAKLITEAEKMGYLSLEDWINQHNNPSFAASLLSVFQSKDEKERLNKLRLENKCLNNELKTSDIKESMLLYNKEEATKILKIKCETGKGTWK